MTTRKQASDLRGTLMSKVREGSDLIESIYQLYDADEVQELMPALITPILDMAAILTTGWYDDLSPESEYRPREFFTVSEGRINYTTAWSYKLAGEARPVEHMLGAFQRMVFDSSRQVVVNNAKAEGVQWHRDAREEACDFCRLLTVEPMAYQGKYVDMPSHNHDCECLAVVSRAGNLYVPPDYVEGWKAQVDANKSRNMTTTLAGMADARV